MRLTTIFLAFLAFTAQPALAASSPGLAPLEQQLSYLLANKSADVGVAALDLKTGEMVSIKGETPFPMASTVKVAVAALYLAQVDHGRRSLDDRISGQSARSLMRAMLIRSDNRATDVLMRDLGGPQVLDSWLRDNGVRGLRVDRNIAQLLRAKRDLWDRRDSSTPVAMVDLLSRIYKGGADQPEQPQLPARRDGPVHDRQEPDARSAAVRNAGRAQDRHAQRLFERRRLHQHARRPPAGDRGLRPRRRRPAAHHRPDRPRDLRRLLEQADTGRTEPPAAAARCCCTSSRAARSAALPKPSSSSAISSGYRWPTKLTELPERGGTMPPAAGNSVTILLDERGQALSSMDLARRLEQWRDGGKREARFVIGAADGHAQPNARRRPAAVVRRGDLAAPAGPGDARRAIVPGDVDPCQPPLSPRGLGMRLLLAASLLLLAGPAAIAAGGNAGIDQARREAAAATAPSSSGSSKPPLPPATKHRSCGFSRSPPPRPLPPRKRKSAPPTARWRCFALRWPSRTAGWRPSARRSPRCCPASRLMGRRPPIALIADSGSARDLVRMKLLIGAITPAIEARTAALVADIERSRSIQLAAGQARNRAVASRKALEGQKIALARLEARSHPPGRKPRRRRRSAPAMSRSHAGKQWRASSGRAPPRARRALPPPNYSASAPRRCPPTLRRCARRIAYQLPVNAPLTEGMGSVSDNGVRSRGLTFATRARRDGAGAGGRDHPLFGPVRRL